ncbi:MAG TPA: 50S ribosomal protein L19 [Candidatus Azoamicus sp. OHIO2]
MTILKKIEQLQLKDKNFNFKVGDKICVNFKIMDSNIRKKNYNFEGLVISIKNNGLNSTCTIRKISLGEGVEKTFFIYNTNINFIKIIKLGLVKQAKLYYMRHKKI